ncbi:glycine oxidase [Rhodoferax koreense]|uniref:D-amino-acid oxidase n=1 Tax=Rhodoferax koreensis TaxID=1842727 RepID=A0A1P8JXN7_9BURK|nr:FAD-dependent oxidoreductase [Rhodoferax koreense]APW38508.1 glycine oxidase [Rhodoferax koreense]
MEALTSSSSVAILGAGLMGRLLALALVRKGCAVALFDAGGPEAEGSAARVAAAMLAPLAESAVTEASVVRMGHHALARWPQLIAQLDCHADAPVFFQREGTLILWHRQDAPEAARLRQQLQTTQRQLPELPAMQALDADGIAALEPSLGHRFGQGFYLPGEGQLDNRALLAALLQTLERSGVHLHWHSPRAPEQFRPGATGQPHWVFDCRGLGARPDWSGLRGVRGEVVRVLAPEVMLTRPTRLIHPRYPLYIAPKPGGVYVIGATEIESDDLSPASVRSTLELLSAAYSVHSGFAEARILEIATQCRPALPDNLPALRRLAPNVLQINGLYRHGFMISPAVLDAVLQWVETGEDTLARRFALRIENPLETAA